MKCGTAMPINKSEQVKPRNRSKKRKKADFVLIFENHWIPLLNSSPAEFVRHKQ